MCIVLTRQSRFLEIFGIQFYTYFSFIEELVEWINGIELLTGQKLRISHGIYPHHNNSRSKKVSEKARIYKILNFMDEKKTKIHISTQHSRSTIIILK